MWFWNNPQINGIVQGLGRENTVTQQLSTTMEMVKIGDLLESFKTAAAHTAYNGHRLKNTFAWDGKYSAYVWRQNVYTTIQIYCQAHQWFIVMVCSRTAQVDIWQSVCLLGCVIIISKSIPNILTTKNPKHACGASYGISRYHLYSIFEMTTLYPTSYCYCSRAIAT